MNEAFCVFQSFSPSLSCTCCQDRGAMIIPNPQHGLTDHLTTFVIHHLDANGHQIECTVVKNNCDKQRVYKLFTGLAKIWWDSSEIQHFVLKQANIYCKNSQTNKQAISASCAAERAGLQIFRTAPNSSGQWQGRGSVARRPPVAPVAVAPRRPEPL